MYHAARLVVWLSQTGPCKLFTNMSLWSSSMDKTAAMEHRHSRISSEYRALNGEQWKIHYVNKCYEIHLRWGDRTRASRQTRVLASSRPARHAQLRYWHVNEMNVRSLLPQFNSLFNRKEIRNRKNNKLQKKNRLDRSMKNKTWRRVLRIIAMNCNRALNLTEYGLITQDTSAPFKTINQKDV